MSAKTQEARTPEFKVGDSVFAPITPRHKNLILADGPVYGLYKGRVSKILPWPTGGHFYQLDPRIDNYFGYELWRDETTARQTLASIFAAQTFGTIEPSKIPLITTKDVEKAFKKLTRNLDEGSRIGAARTVPA